MIAHPAKPLASEGSRYRFVKYNGFPSRGIRLAMRKDFYAALKWVKLVNGDVDVSYLVDHPPPFIFDFSPRKVILDSCFVDFASDVIGARGVFMITAIDGNEKIVIASSSNLFSGESRLICCCLAFTSIFRVEIVGCDHWRVRRLGFFGVYS